MYVLIKTPLGAWQYVKDSPEGLRYGIYNNDALQGEASLLKCQAQYPQFEFKLGA